MRLARVLAFQFRNRASGFLGCVLNVSIRLEPRMLVDLRGSSYNEGLGRRRVKS